MVTVTRGWHGCTGPSQCQLSWDLEQPLGLCSATMELPGGMWRDEVLRELGAQGGLCGLGLLLEMALMDLGTAGGGTWWWH